MKAKIDTLLRKFDAIEYRDPQHEYTMDLKTKFRDRAIVATVRIQDVFENRHDDFTAIATTTSTIFKLHFDQHTMATLDTSRFKGFRRYLIAVDSLEMHKVLDLDLSFQYEKFELADLEDGRGDFGVKLRRPYFFAKGRLLEVVKSIEY